MSSSDLREGFDLFLGDMATGQAVNGRLPLPSENQDLAVSLFVEKENRGDFKTEAAATSTTSDRHELPKNIKSAPDEGDRDLSPFTAACLNRFNLLLSTHDSKTNGVTWHLRASWVQNFFNTGHRERYALEMVKMLDDSRKLFGEWRPISAGGVLL